MTTHGFSEEEMALRMRLVSELQSGQKTLLQIQQELADYKDPDAAELRRFREREVLIQAQLSAAAEALRFWGMNPNGRVTTRFMESLAQTSAAVRDFVVKP